MYVYDALVVRVVDGDTMDLNVDLGFRIWIKQRFRIDGIDTPETWRPKSEAEDIHGQNATKRSKELLEGKLVKIHSTYAGIYDRWGCSIILPDGRDYATVMLQEGYEKLESYGGTD